MKRARRLFNCAVVVSVTLFISAPFAVIPVTSHSRRMLLVYGMQINDPPRLLQTAITVGIMTASTVLPVIRFRRYRGEGLRERGFFA